MSSYTAIFDENNTFENWSWACGTDCFQNSYSNIGMDIYLFTSPNFATYQTWILTGNASARATANLRHPINQNFFLFPGRAYSF